MMIISIIIIIIIIITTITMQTTRWQGSQTTNWQAKEGDKPPTRPEPFLERIRSNRRW